MIFPKRPQILYAPMLATMGGGSANGFRSSGGADYGYWGLDYDGWDGSHLDMTDSERASNYNITTGDTDWNGLQGHLSHYHGRVYKAYPNQTYQSFVGQSSNYPNPVTNSSVTSYYNMGGTTTFNSNNTNGRAMTLAYLGDNTPVFVASYDDSSYPRRLSFWDATLGSSTYMQHLGYRQMSGSLSPGFNFQTNSGAANWLNGEYAFIMYDGSGLIVKARNGTYDGPNTWIKVDLPSDSNIADGGTAQFYWVKDSSLTDTTYDNSTSYGAAYMGMDDSGYRYIYENYKTNGNGGRIVRLNPQVQGGTASSWVMKSSTSYGGGYGVNGQDFEIPTYEYACMIDYKNKKLLTGSHANSGTFAVFDLV